MASEAQVRKFVAPYLHGRDDVVYAKRLLILKPLRHILLAVDLGRASEPTRIAVGTVVVPMYYPDFIHVTWGWGVARGGNKSFTIDDLEGLSELSYGLDNDALPRLRAIRDIAGLRVYCETHPNHSVFKNGLHLWTACALGEWDEARRICEDWKKRGWLEGPGYDADATKRIERRALVCDLVCRDDRAGMIKLLHETEAANARSWGLEGIWEPSPFPAEQKM